MTQVRFGAHIQGLHQLRGHGPKIHGTDAGSIAADLVQGHLRERYAQFILENTPDNLLIRIDANQRTIRATAYKSNRPALTIPLESSQGLETLEEYQQNLEDAARQPITFIRNLLNLIVRSAAKLTPVKEKPETKE